MKYTILICLLGSIGFLIFTILGEKKMTDTEKNVLSSDAQKKNVESVMQKFETADNNGKQKIFNDYLTGINKRDTFLSAAFGDESDFVSVMVGAACILNFMALVCIFVSRLKQISDKS